MSRRKRIRVKFSMKERIRDHHDCIQYDTDWVDEDGRRRDSCLTQAFKLNRPRVCVETCKLFIEPHPKEALIIAETLEDWLEKYGRGTPDDDEK